MSERTDRNEDHAVPVAGCVPRPVLLFEQRAHVRLSIEKRPTRGLAQLGAVGVAHTPLAISSEE